MKKLNRKQYDLVKIFLAMGNTVHRIAAEWKAPPAEVMKANVSGSYEQYRRDDMDPRDWLFGQAFGNF